MRRKHRRIKVAIQVQVMAAHGRVFTYRWTKDLKLPPLKMSDHVLSFDIQRVYR